MPMSTTSSSRANYYPVPDGAEEPLWLQNLTNHAQAMLPHHELPEGLQMLMAWREEFISRLMTPGEAWGLTLDAEPLATADGDAATSDCEVATSDCEVATAGCEVTTAGCEVTTAGCEVATAGCEVATAGCEVATAGCDALKPCGKLSLAAYFQTLRPRRIAPWHFGRAA